MRAGIIQGHHALRAPLVDHRADALVNDIQRLIPGNLPKMPLAARAGAHQRVADATRPMHEITRVMRDFFAYHASRILQRTGSAHLHDPVILDRDGQTTGIGAVERANAGVFGNGHVDLPGFSLVSDVPALSACEFLTILWDHNPGQSGIAEKAQVWREQ